MYVCHGIYCCQRWIDPTRFIMQVTFRPERNARCSGLQQGILVTQHSLHTRVEIRWRLLACSTKLAGWTILLSVFSLRGSGREPRCYRLPFAGRAHPRSGRPGGRRPCLSIHGVTRRWTICRAFPLTAGMSPGCQACRSPSRPYRVCRSPARQHQPHLGMPWPVATHTHMQSTSMSMGALVEQHGLFALHDIDPSAPCSGRQISEAQNERRVTSNLDWARRIRRCHPACTGSKHAEMLC